MTNLDALELIMENWDLPYESSGNQLFIPAKDCSIVSILEAHSVTSPEDKAIAIHFYPIPRKRKENIKTYDSVVEAASVLIQLFYKKG